MFVTHQQNSGKLPVLLLTGFLGSGKTTLVNALLKDPRLADTAVAINEFGAVPLDQHLVDEGQDRTVVLANGCLCCNVAGDMEEAVMRIFSRRQTGDLPRFRRLIVEPSGLADPAPIAQAILRNPVMSRYLRLEGIVATVDALFGLSQLERHAESRKQVALADTLVLTKTDLAAADAVEALKAKLRALNPTAHRVEARHGAVDAASLTPAGFLDPDAASAPRGLSWIAEAVEADPAHTRSVTALTLIADKPLAWRAVEAWLRDVRIELADRLLRLKGLIAAAEADGPVVVQGVHHVMHPPVTLDRWPDSDHRTRIVLIVQRSPELGSPELESPDWGLEARWAEALPRLYTCAPDACALAPAAA
jgi:G3E family GTPase